MPERENGGKPSSIPRRYVGASTQSTERVIDEEAHIVFATPTTPLEEGIGFVEYIGDSPIRDSHCTSLGRPMEALE